MMVGDVIQRLDSFKSGSMTSASRGDGSNSNIISPTHKRIELFHASLGVPPEAAIRPTEAQLRWAQFHSQERAKDTQRKIKKLYRYPINASDIIGIIPGQDDVSSSSSSSLGNEEDRSFTLGGIHPPVQTIFIKRKRRHCAEISQIQKRDQPHSIIRLQHQYCVPKAWPRISRGRKALLRVSSRNYQLRKQQLKQTYYIEPSATTDSAEEMKLAQQHDETMESAPNQLLSTPQRRMRARMNGRVRSKVFSHVQLGTEAEEERVRRFQEAIHAITLGFSSSTVSADNQTIATSSSTTKRWKRQSSDASPVDFNSISRFGSIGHPNMLLGVSTVILQRRNQRHVQGINVEHTDSWIRYIQLQQQQPEVPEKTKPAKSGRIVGRKHEATNMNEAETLPGEKEFVKLRTRLQNFSCSNGRRVIPDAYKNTYTHRKEKPEVELSQNITGEKEGEQKVGINFLVPSHDPRYSHEVKPRLRNSQTLLDAPPDGANNDVSQEHLKKWKQSHERISITTKEFHTTSGVIDSASPNFLTDLGKSDAFLGEDVKDLPPISEAPTNKVTLNSKVGERQQHLKVCSTVSTFESHSTSVANPSSAPDNHGQLQKDYNMAADDEHSESLLNPEMIKRWLELNGDIIDDIESVVTTPTDVGEEEYRQRLLGTTSNVPSLVLTPSLLTKRLRQCIRIIENHEWEKASYLISANPWLIEMTDVLNGQVLLHALALHGETAPDKLNNELVDAFPSSVHKFDDAGNLALHFACESGNVPMIRLLGDKFPGGASVQNVSGLLPLHLAVLSAIPEAVREVASLFPGATAVQDNEGNLPLHLTSTLQGNDVLHIVRLLLSFDTPVRIQQNVTKSFTNETGNFDSFDESDFDFPTTPKYMETGLVLNNDYDSPLVMAVKAVLGWEVVEALLKGSGGKQAALECNSSGENALHLAAMGEFADPSVVLTLLKFVPIAATIPNGDGMLPIELVGMQGMPKEVILALVLIDLPFKRQNDRPVLRDGYGKSWLFLVCDCDDEYHAVVKEVLLMCSYHEAIALCSMKGGTSSKSWTVISRATPKCKHELRMALRFAGRYEFVGNGPKKSDSFKGLTVYDAFDFGSDSHPIEGERKVTLKCFSKEKFYKEEIQILQKKCFNCLYVEEVFFFTLHDLKEFNASSIPQQYCIAIESPALTLGTVVGRAPRGNNWRKEEGKFSRYMKKVCAVLHKTAVALQYLHGQNVIHGMVCLDTIGKFGENWKLISISCAKQKGSVLPQECLNRHSPPEAVRVAWDDEDPLNALRGTRTSFMPALVAEPSYDIWSYGKLCYEALSGEDLLPFDLLIDPREDTKTLKLLGGWSEESLKKAVHHLLDLGATALGADLITRCLQAKRADRPQSMGDILRHAFWKEVKGSGQSRKFSA